MVLAGEAVYTPFGPLRLEVELEFAVKRLRRVGVGPVKVDAVHADAAGRDGDGLGDDLLRGHAEHLRAGEDEAEGLERGQVELEGLVLLLEVRTSGELDGVGNVVAVRQARVAEIGDGHGLQQRARRPRDAAEVEDEVHAGGGENRPRRDLAPVEHADVVDLQAAREAECGGVRAHEEVVARKRARDASQDEVGDGLLEEENGRKGEEKEAEEAEERVFDDFSERPHGAPNLLKPIGSP